jgi:hypothetical protein
MHIQAFWEALGCIHEKPIKGGKALWLWEALSGDPRRQGALRPAWATEDAYRI